MCGFHLERCVRCWLRLNFIIGTTATIGWFQRRRRYLYASILAAIAHRCALQRARGDRQLPRVDQRGSSPSRPGNPAHGLRQPCLARDLTLPGKLIYSGALNATLSCCLACVGSFSASRQDPCWSRRSNDCPSARLTQSFLIRVPCRPVSSSIPHSVLLRRPYCH